MWECSLCVKYVYITALTAVLFQRHTWREDTTNSNQGAAGGSSLLSLCYVGTPTTASELVYGTHLKEKERKNKKDKSKNKIKWLVALRKNGLIPMTMETRCSKVIFPNYSKKKPAEDTLVPPLWEHGKKMFVFLGLFVHAAVRGGTCVFTLKIDNTLI